MLFKSADQFIIGAVATARNFQVSPIVIGLTIVAFGTSAPEIFVSAISSFENKLGLAVGNIVGSNIFNILA
ncbi:MAG: calcium/sodium antiporter, partial [Pseudomonadales bacterium]|nr:calcium/sodium antiporter [Pseudomonadales bacterium]